MHSKGTLEAGLQKPNKENLKAEMMIPTGVSKRGMVRP
jgi:hypothetical protein